MKETHDFEHHFVHPDAVGKCHIRVYEQEGERPVVVATQRPDQPEPSIKTIGLMIAWDLMRKGIVKENPRAVTKEMIKERIKTGKIQQIRNSAPFWFVVEVLEPSYEVTFLWFTQYRFTQYAPTKKSMVGNIIPQKTTLEEVENLIGQSLQRGG